MKTNLKKALEPWAGQVCPELSYLTSYAVGHAVSVYWLGLELFGAKFPSKGRKYQVMRQSELEGPGYAFWRWHQVHGEEFFDTPEAACANYLASHREWLRRSQEEA